MTKQKGMTILEIMAILAIIVVLVTMIYSTFSVKTFEGKPVVCSGGVLYFVDGYLTPQTPVIDKDTKEPVLCTKKHNEYIQ